VARNPDEFVEQCSSIEVGLDEKLEAGERPSVGESLVLVGRILGDESEVGG